MFRGCSGLFRGCSGLFRAVPAFTDTRFDLLSLISVMFKNNRLLLTLKRNKVPLNKFTLVNSTLMATMARKLSISKRVYSGYILKSIERPRTICFNHRGVSGLTCSCYSVTLDHSTQRVTDKNIGKIAFY